MACCVMCCDTGCGSGCGTGCGSGCGTGCGSGCCTGCGSGRGSGHGGALVDHGTSYSVDIGTGGSSVIIPGPRLRENGCVRTCCHCVCASDCCMPSCGCCGAHGENGPGARVDISHPCYEVDIPAGYLCSNIHCANASVNCCCEPCCGPC